MILKDMRKYLGLSNIVRYSTRVRLKDESVAEHSFFVALAALLLAQTYNRFINQQQVLSGHIDMRVLEMALIHDLPEVSTGDVSYDLRKRSRPIEVELKHQDSVFASEELTAWQCDLLDEFNRGESPEAVIVNAADKLSVVLYMEREVLLGNTFMAKDFARAWDDFWRVLDRLPIDPERLIEFKKLVDVHGHEVQE